MNNNGKLGITAEYVNGRTVITHCEFTSPLKIAQPFYRNGYTEIMMMTASAGLLDGDFYDIDINVKENARLEFTAQSYLKIFRAKQNGASQKIKINVENGGALAFLPCPAIPFAESIYDCKTEISLSQKSRFVMTDIFSCGRTAMNERFMFGSYRTRTAVFVDDRMCFLDNQRLVPSETDLSGTGFFEGYSHCGMMFAYNIDLSPQESCFKVLSASSLAERGICVRALADSADEIAKYFSEIITIKSALSC